MLNYTDIIQNTYVQSRTVTEIMAREKCGRQVSTYCRPSVTSYLSIAPARSTRHVNPVTLACALQRTVALTSQDNISCCQHKVLGSLRTTTTRVRVFL